MFSRNQSTPFPTQVTVTTSPSLNLRTSASHLVSSTVTSRWYSVKRRISSSVGPKPCSCATRRFSFSSVMNGIASMPIFLNRSIAAASPLKPFRELVQTLGDLRQNLGGGFHLPGGGMEIDPHPAQRSPRLFAFVGIVVRCLG